jgi:signal transduction histidine kinase
MQLLKALAGAWTAWRTGRFPSSDSPDAALASRWITVQENERKRLSRELHDGIGQIVTALKMELSRVEPANEASADRLARARSYGDEALTTIRSISRLLRPTLLDDLGLEAALEWHTGEFSRRTGIRCRLEYEVPENSAWPEPVNTCIYRVTQEALNNCEKYAGATEILVRVEPGDSELRVTIADNGKGMETRSTLTPGLGILGMRERASMLGGDLRIESLDGRGTTVLLTVPAAALAL